MTLPINPDSPWLAPLAGYSDLPFRLLCRSYGADVACTEMISAKGLIYNSPGTNTLLQTTQEDVPLVVQLFGSDPSYMEKAASMLCHKGFVYFDINAGCPVKKVIKTGSGAALLKNSHLLLEMTQRLVRVCGSGKVGVKFRSGWNATSLEYITLGKALEDHGAAWITLHPRTAVQGFTGRADTDHLKQLKAAVSIPVIGSGDLFTADDALNLIQSTDIDCVMFARGAMRNPGVFLEYKNTRTGGDTPAVSLVDIIKKHTSLAQEYGSPRSLFTMRTFIPRYLRNFEGAKELRTRFALCSSWRDLELLVSELEKIVS